MPAAAVAAAAVAVAAAATAAAAAAAERAPKRGARGPVAAVRQRCQRCGSYGGARQTGGSRQACFVKVEGTQLWRTRNRKLLLKLTRGTSMVMEFQVLKEKVNVLLKVG